jgi:hypothetical protein
VSLTTSPHFLSLLFREILVYLHSSTHFRTVGYTASAKRKEELVQFQDASLPGYELGSKGIELSWQLQNNGKNGIRRCKEDFMCEFK